MIVAQILEDAAHGNVARAVERRVDDFEIAAGVGVHHFFHGGGIGVVHFRRDDVDVGIVVGGELNAEIVVDGAHFRDDGRRGFFGDLTAVGAVDFVAVVFFGIVGRGDDHAAGAAQMTDGK